MLSFKTLARQFILILNNVIERMLRQGKSTLDHLVRFETFIRNAFAKKEHAVSYLFRFRKSIRHNMKIWHYIVHILAPITYQEVTYIERTLNVII
jgi:hypothetical protein